MDYLYTDTFSSIKIDISKRGCRLPTRVFSYLILYTAVLSYIIDILELHAFYSYPTITACILLIAHKLTISLSGLALEELSSHLAASMALTKRPQPRQTTKICPIYIVGCSPPNNATKHAFIHDRKARSCRPSIIGMINSKSLIGNPFLCWT